MGKQPHGSRFVALGTRPARRATHFFAKMPERRRRLWLRADARGATLTIRDTAFKRLTWHAKQILRFDHMPDPSCCGSDCARPITPAENRPVQIAFELRGAKTEYAGMSDVLQSLGTH